LAPLIDSTATTSALRVPASIVNANQTVGGDTTRPPGWQAIGTHREADTLLTPGGWTLPAGQIPELLMAGGDSTSATVGARVMRALRVHEGGSQFWLPGGAYAAAGTWQTPLMAIGGGLVLANATANTTALTNSLASNFGHITDVLIVCTLAGTGAQTVKILDASAGTAVFSLITSVATAGDSFPFHFSSPPRTAAVGTTFFVSTSGTTGTWGIMVNGFFSTGI
jgi:hypothetical protein